MPSGLPLTSLNVILGQAAQQVGASGFYPALLKAFRALVPHDIATVVRYSAVGAPAFMLHHGFSDDLARQYESTFFVFDPFYRYWSTTEQPGVVTLGMFSAASVKLNRYVGEFLRNSEITDELGIFLPAIGRSSVALFLERSVGRFSPTEKACVEDFYPLLAGLEIAHINNIVASEHLHSDRRDLPRAIMIRDREGALVHASQTWCDLEATDPALARAVQRLVADNAGEAVLGSGLVLNRSKVSAAHAFAPQGWLFVIEKAAANAPDYDQAIIARLSPTLTPREVDIVKLILEGHPTIAIAQRLKLQRGTVKNHRLRIYEKLDITSERELFIAYIRALQQGRAGG